LTLDPGIAMAARRSQAPVHQRDPAATRGRVGYPLALTGWLAWGLVLGLPGAQAQAQRAPYPDVAVSWAAVENIYDAGFRFLITLENGGDVPLPASGWELYFGMMRRLDTVAVPSSIRLEHINGDFYRITPTAEFLLLPPGGRLVLPLAGAAMAIARGDAARGFYFVVDDQPIALGPVSVAPFVHDAQTMRSAADRLPVPTTASRHDAHRGLSLLGRDQVTPITPTPMEYQRGTGLWTLDRGAVVRHGVALAGEARLLVDAMEPVLGARLGVEDVGDAADVGGVGDVLLRVDPGLGAEAYTLTIGPGRAAEIVGGDPAGVLYGIQSFRALVPVAAYTASGGPVEIPAVRVRDRPGFRYRGMHVDVARNFQPVESVRRLLDVMSLYKLNHLHFHLTDDEGWRLEIAGLPELTAVGGRRGHTLDEREHLIPSFGSGPYPDRHPGSGWFTRDEYTDLVRYARQRHITIVPEIDMPGHARAAIVAMEARYRNLIEQGREAEASEFRLHDPADTSTYRSVQHWDDNVINVCQESAYRFMERVIADLAAMHAEAGAPLEQVHVGGDEVPVGVWQGSPVCAALIAATPGLDDPRQLFEHFIHRTADILDGHGIRLAGWEEIALTNPYYVAGPKSPSPEGVQRRFLPYVWNAVWGWGSEDLGYRLANAGYEIVMSNASALYFDMAYEKDPEEDGLYWAGFVGTRTAWEFLPFDLFPTARLDIMGNPIGADHYADAVRPTADGRRNILGIQGQLWSETLVEPSRLEYMAFPRILALAERAWTPEPDWARIDDGPRREQALGTAWNEFANRLGQRELPRLDHLHGGIGYRIPVPGGVVRDGILHASAPYPGLAIHYTTDGTDPTVRSPRYAGPVAVDGPVTLRVFDTRGRGGRAARVE
jgi:hexosaminidase